MKLEFKKMIKHIQRNPTFYWLLMNDKNLIQICFQVWFHSKFAALSTESNIY